MPDINQVEIAARAHDILVREYAGKTLTHDDLRAIRARAARELQAHKQQTAQAIAMVHTASL